MSTASFFRLVALAAIWGGAFLFIRIGVPVLGPVLLIELRVGLAAIFLFLVSLAIDKRLDAKTHWRHYLVIGLFNSALPFLLFAIAAKTLSASLLSILNATSPIWGAIIGAIWNREALSWKTVTGLILGIVGVTVLVGLDKATLQPGATTAVICSLAAAFCYGIATIYAKSAKKVDPFSNAHGSMWAATLLIAPAVPFFPAYSVPGVGILSVVLALGIVCSGIAYLLYFRLVADLGAASALTVTFLIPVFGVLWGHLVLEEPVTWQMGIGALIVIIGTSLVTGFSPSVLFKKQTSTSI